MEDKIMAVVDGIDVKRSDLDKIVAKYPENQRLYFETEQGMKQLLEQKVAFMLMSRYAAKEGLDSSEEYIKNLEEIKEQLLTQIVMSKIFSEIEIEDSELEKIYEENKERYIEAESLVCKHILTETEEEIKKIKEDIENGAITFEEAAKQYSKCPSKQREGNLGVVKRGMMVKEFEDAAFALDANVISDIVKTQFGYHIIKVDEKKDAYTKEYEEVKEALKEQVMAVKQQNKYEEKMNELKKIYAVDIKEA